MIIKLVRKSLYNVYSSFVVCFTKSRVSLFFYKKGFLKENLGDYLSVLILKKLGYRFNRLSQKRVGWALYHRGRIKNHLLLFAVGTIIDNNWLDKIDGQILIWGSGARDEKAKIDHYSDIKIKAVRGPKTRDVLGLPKDFILGDPGLLLPHFYPCKKNNQGEVIFVPHYTRKRNNIPQGATKLIDPNCNRFNIIKKIKQIAQARFVLTQSLHGAIIAQAYGVPWAFLNINNGCEKINNFKWSDWGAYLGIDIKNVSSYRAGLAWWQAIGRLGRVSGLDELLQSFPHEEFKKCGVIRKVKKFDIL